MGAALRELLVAFDVDGEKAGAALKGLTSTIDSVKERLGGLAIGLAGTLAAGAGIDFIKSQIEIGSAINDTSERLGVATDELQKFQFASKLGGIENEEAATALGFLNKNLGLAASGNQAAAAAFQTMHIAVRDASGAVRPTTDVLLDLADAINKTDSPALRTSKAISILGRAGGRLVPILAGGRKELSGLYKEAEDLGGVMSEEFVHGADTAGDEIDKLKFASQGLKAKLAQLLFPAVLRVTDAIKFLSMRIHDLTNNTNILEDSLVVLSGVGIYATIKSLQGMAKAFGLAKLGASGFISSALYLTAVAAIVAGIVLLFDELYTLFTGGDSALGDLIDEMYGVGASAQFIQQVSAAFADLNSFIDALKAPLSALDDAFEAIFGKSIEGTFLWVLKSTLELSRVSLEKVNEGLHAMIGLLGKAFSMAGNSALGRIIGPGGGFDALQEKMLAAGGKLKNISGEQASPSEIAAGRAGQTVFGPAAALAGGGVRWDRDQTVFGPPSALAGKGDKGVHWNGDHRQEFRINVNVPASSIPKGGTAEDLGKSLGKEVAASVQPDHQNALDALRRGVGGA